MRRRTFVWLRGAFDFVAAVALVVTMLVGVVVLVGILRDPTWAGAWWE